MRLRDSVQDEVKDAVSTDKGIYLQSQLDIINRRLHELETFITTHVQRYKHKHTCAVKRCQSHVTCHMFCVCVRLHSLRSLLKGLLNIQDVVKVYEARLTEKETTSLDPEDLQKYQNELKVNLYIIYMCRSTGFSTYMYSHPFSACELKSVEMYNVTLISLCSENAE